MPDLRALALAAGAWFGALLVLLVPGPWAAVAVGVVVLAGVWGVVARRLVVGWLGPVVAMAGVAAVAGLQGAAATSTPVTDLAEQRAVVTLTVDVRSDARRVEGQFADMQVLKGQARQVTGRGAAWQVSVPVVVIADVVWPAPELGARVRVPARLAPADDGAAAIVRPLDDPVLLSEPDLWWDGAAAVRASVREAVAGRGQHERELVPALVTGDDSGFATEVADDFRKTGLTHLLAVSGTNLTLVVGFLVVLGRWAGVRGRGTWALAASGIVGFVLLARTEPSVVRAAAMGTVALVGMGSNGLSRGTRCLGVAALLLLLFDPRLAVTAGFALSVLATAGILVLAPAWRDALHRWLPLWAAEATAVPLAAQVACTPVVAGLSGEVSLVAVVANMLVAPAVAPATVLGLAGGLIGLVWAPAGALVAAPGAWAAGWIIAVARWGADLPTPALTWGTGPVPLAVLTGLCIVLVVAAPRVLGHPLSATSCCLVLVVAIFVRVPVPGWPPDGWVLAMCDVGQGDALVLNAGSGRGVVVDVGPDPRAVDECLRRLRVSDVPLVVLTHFHADHVGGITGVLRGRRVGAVESTHVAEPADGLAAVRAAIGASPEVASYAATRRVGDVALQTVWPPPGPRWAHAGANDASVVLLAEVGGVRVLLTGDVEPPAQAALARALPGLAVDVLKVPHHGSRHQDLDWLTSLGARAALVSVGEDNDYGHPSAQVVAALESSGATVWRSDVSGDVVVSVLGGQPGVSVRD